MNFHSLTFLLFFILFYAVYWGMLRKNIRFRNMSLLAASLFFYGWWDWRFISLILLSITATYSFAILAEKSGKKIWTATSICINASILCIFKYLDFFTAQFQRIAANFFPEINLTLLGILAPVGISFYTFQAIGYAVDVYRRKVKAEHDYVDFAVFISFFPQLVAGPIEQASQLLPQIKSEHRWRYAEQVEGCRRILWGLLKKVAIADPCGMFVERYMANAETSPVYATLMAILFTVQIYCDFSGYCDIAIGTARCLGIRLSENFRTPYFSTDIQDFWRRWNISLMRWFRDYIYIPLGGSHSGKTHTAFNILTVFLLSGLWHGASPHFVVWGLYWGLLMVAFRIAGPLSRHIIKGSTNGLAGIPIVMFWVSSGLVIFRSSTVPQAVHILINVMPLMFAVALSGSILTRLASCQTVKKIFKHMRIPTMVAITALAAAALFHAPLTKFIAQYYIWAFIVIFFMAEWHTRRRLFPLQDMKVPVWGRFIIYWIGIILVLTGCYDDTPFIYFQF